MNEYLEKALSELNNTKAEGLPPIDEITKAKDSSIWSGLLHNGGKWELIKHHEHSYTSSSWKDR